MNAQTCANSSDQPCALTLALSDSLRLTRGRLRREHAGAGDKSRFSASDPSSQSTVTDDRLSADSLAPSAVSNWLGARSPEADEGRSSRFR